MLQIARLMIMMHHNVWYIITVIVVGFVALLYGSNIQNVVGRTIVLGIAVVALAFVMATGAVVGPLDNWQHQHGSCLLDSLNNGKEVKK